MDAQEYFNMIANDGRAKTLAKSDQLTLGEMILKLEPIVKYQESRVADEDREEAKVCFDFEYLHPTAIDSWRGSYAELALDFENNGYDNQMSVTEFCNMLKKTVGKTFDGYKGGKYTMNKHTPVWVANWGNSGNTAVVDIVDNSYEVIIITGYREF